MLEVSKTLDIIIYYYILSMKILKDATMNNQQET